MAYWWKMLIFTFLNMLIAAVCSALSLNVWSFPWAKRKTPDLQPQFTTILKLLIHPLPYYYCINFTLGWDSELEAIIKKSNFRIKFSNLVWRYPLLGSCFGHKFLESKFKFTVLMSTEPLFESYFSDSMKVEVERLIHEV